MPTCSNIQRSLAWCQGTPVLPGVRRRLYYISKGLIVQWPQFVRNSEGKITSSTLSGSFVLAADASWKYIDILPDKSQLTSEAQGEIPSQTQLNKLTAVHPGVGEDASLLAACINNDDNVFIVQDMNGSFRVVGSEKWMTKSSVAQDLGQGATGSASTTLTVEATDEIASPFYTGSIVTEDGTINAGSGELGYSLTVQSEDTNKGTVSGGGTYEEGDSPTFTAEAKTGYAFEGWYVDDEKISSSNPGTLDMPAEDVTVVAKFVTAETCSLSVESDNSSWGLVQIDDFTAADHDAQTFNKGTTHTIRAIATSGHYFVEWSDHNSDNPRTVTLTASQNFEASFEQS